MIIPIRCFTCGKVLADKWHFFVKRIKELLDKHEIDVSNMTIESLDIDERNKLAYFDSSFKGQVLDELDLCKICCRRHMLGHVDLIDDI